MQLKELYETWDVEPLFLATATNGLDPKKDKVLAVASATATEEEVPLVFFNKTLGEDLVKAQRYHQISVELMTQFGREYTDFVEAVQGRFQKKILFSYNAPFQYAFLSALLNEPSMMIYDLTVIEQALRKGLAFTEEELVTPGSFYSACSSHYYPLPVSTVYKRLNVSKQPPPGELPVEWAVDVLQMLYNGVSSKELSLLES